MKRPNNLSASGLSLESRFFDEKENSMRIMRSVAVCYLFLWVAILWGSVARADSAALAVTIGARDIYSNAEFNPTGNPIGGGAGYHRLAPTGPIATTGANVTIVDNRDDLVRAITTAASGTVVYVRDNAAIDLTGSGTITIPGGVTVASGRGKNGSPGALLYVTEWPGAPLFKTGGPFVRITGLRIQGQDQRERTSGNLSTGVLVTARNAEIENCEIYGWPHAGIYALENGFGLNLHHNYIHHNYGNGHGYGVTLDAVDALIEANYFDYHRHGIAGTGRVGTSYEARYNIFGKNFQFYPVDMHGGGDRPDGTNIAGDWMVVHHNTFYTTDPLAGGVHVSGVPRQGAWIFSNWFAKYPTVTNRFYTDLNPTVKSTQCSPCFGTTNLQLYRIFSFKNRVGIGQWGAMLPLYYERDHVGDFNGDGRLDLITFATNGDFLVRKRIPNRGFETSRRWGRNGSDLGDMRRYRIADINADGRSDVISFESNGGIYVWIATANNSFIGPSQWGSNGADIGPSRYKIGDFNRDGRADVISFESNNNFYVWLAQSGGGFRFAGRWGFNGADHGTSDRYRIADVDGDGRTDIVSIEGARFYVWKSLDNAFSSPMQWGHNGAALDTYRYQLGNGGGGILSDVISFESNGGKYIWNSNGTNAFVLWGEWFNSW